MQTLKVISKEASLNSRLSIIAIKSAKSMNTKWRFNGLEKRYMLTSSQILGSNPSAGGLIKSGFKSSAIF
jgi:hypothetical protein